jgi:hypothetical protein
MMAWTGFGVLYSMLYICLIMGIQTTTKCDPVPCVLRSRWTDFSLKAGLVLLIYHVFSLVEQTNDKFLVAKKL